MGWMSGGELAQDLWEIIRENIPSSVRQKVARKFVRRFALADCDVLDECEQLVADCGQAWFEKHAYGDE